MPFHQQFSTDHYSGVDAEQGERHGRIPKKYDLLLFIIGVCVCVCACVKALKDANKSEKRVLPQINL